MKGRVKWRVLIIVLVAFVVFFMPTPLLKVTDKTVVWEIYYFNSETAESNLLELDNETVAQLLQYLSSRKR